MQEQIVSFPEPQASAGQSSGDATEARSPALWPRLAVAAVAVLLLVTFGREAAGSVPRFAEWVDGLGMWGPLAFVVGYTVAAVAFVPGSLLTLAAGAIFGIAQGVLWVFIGATVGAMAAFFLARTVARRAIEKKLQNNARFAAIDRAVEREGLKIVALLRLSPVFPFNMLNYALGLTRVRPRDYAIACLGMLPGTLLYVYTGKVVGDVAALAGGVATERGVGYWVVAAVGLVATVVVTTLITRTARQALQQITDA